MDELIAQIDKLTKMQLDISDTLLKMGEFILERKDRFSAEELSYIRTLLK